jgi:L-lactate permease
LVSFLLAAGFLYAGVGGQIPLVEYQGTKVTDLPIGIVFLAAGILIAKYWTPSVTVTNTTEGEVNGVKFTRTSTTIKKSFSRPWP